MISKDVVFDGTSLSRRHIKATIIIAIVIRFMRGILHENILK